MGHLDYFACCVKTIQFLILVLNKSIFLLSYLFSYFEFTTGWAEFPWWHTKSSIPLLLRIRIYDYTYYLQTVVKLSIWFYNTRCLKKTCHCIVDCLTRIFFDMLVAQSTVYAIEWWFHFVHLTYSMQLSYHGKPLKPENQESTCFFPCYQARILNARLWQCFTYL